MGIFKKDSFSDWTVSGNNYEIGSAYCSSQKLRSGHSDVAAKARVLCQPQTRHQAWSLHAAHTEMNRQQLGKLKK